MNQRKMLPDLLLLGVALGLPLFIFVGPLAFYFLVIHPSDAESVEASAQTAIISEHAAALATLAAAPERPAFEPSITYSESMVRAGQSNFLGVCAACHGTDARGVVGLGKTLLGSQFVRTNTDDELLDFIIVGRTIWDPVNTTGVAMPARGGNPGFTDRDIQNIIAYIRVTDGTATVGGSDMVANPSTDETENTTPPTPSEPVEFTPIDISALSGGGSEETEDNEPVTRSGRDGETLATLFCEVDETSRAMCEYLSGLEDQARVIDLLTNGSSPFDSDIPAGVVVPQYGGTLFFTDDEVLNLIDFWHPPAPTGDDTGTEVVVRPGRDGATLEAAFCEVDDASRAACDYLRSVDDPTRLIDLLTNGSSPFDSNIPAGVFITQRGGNLFFTDDEILNLVDYWLPPASSESTSDAPAVRPGRSGVEIEAALCEVDDTSRAMCDYLRSLVTEDGANYTRLLDLLKNGSSPFDSSIPEGIVIPQYGGLLLLSDDEVLNFVDYLYNQAGFTSPGQSLTTLPGPSRSEVAIAAPPPDERSGGAVYDALCKVNESSEAICDYLLSVIMEEKKDRNGLFDLLINGSSPFDSSLPEGIVIPQRGGILLLKDEEVQNFLDYLYSEAAAEAGTLGSLTYIDRLQGSVTYPPRQVMDFTVPSTTGEPFTLSEHRGKLIMLYFGYMTCPDVCPATLVDMMRAYREAGEPKDEVTVLFITIDPERDSLDVMSRYLGAFHSDFIGLRPESQEQLDAMMESFGIIAEKRIVEDSALGYLMDHSATVYLLGPDGRMITQFPFGVPYSEITNDLNVLMAYTVAPEKFAGGRVVTESDPAREYRIVIPEGTFSQIMMGTDPGIIPLKIELTLGEKDVLVLENHDNADYLVGGIWVAPYETVRKQFYQPQSFIGLCTVTVGRDLVEIIISEPAS